MPCRADAGSRATAVQMALTLVYWEQLVRYFDRDFEPDKT